MGRALIPLLLAALALLVSCGSSPQIPSDCSVFPAQQTSPYILPYQVGSSYALSFTVGHGGTQYYSLDFAMPTGTPVVASRSGQVVNTEARYLEGDNVFGHENLVWIRHEDGTVARYYHLAHDSVRVAIGDAVSQGDVIGLSDNTGNSTGPHLHFDVTQCLTGLTSADIATLPCGQTIPLSFRNTAPTTCGLIQGTRYVALQY